MAEYFGKINLWLNQTGDSDFDNGNINIPETKIEPLTRSAKIIGIIIWGAFIIMAYKMLSSIL